MKTNLRRGGGVTAVGVMVQQQAGQPGNGESGVEDRTGAQDRKFTSTPLGAVGG